jgi:YidC/Oxa1 family membrane protein insertase
MDRKAIVTLILVIGAYLGYHFGYYMPHYREWQVKHAAWKEQQAKEEAEKKKNAPAETVATTGTSGQTVIEASKVPEIKSAEPAKTETIFSAPGSVEYVFTSAGGGIAKATLKKHFEDKQHGTLVMLNEFGTIPIGALAETPGTEAFTNVPWNMVVDQAAHTVTFDRTDTAKKIKTTKKFTLPREDTLREEYLIALDITYENLGDGPMMLPSNYLHLGSCSPLREGEQLLYQTFNWWRDGSNHSTTADYFSEGGMLFWKHAERPEYRQAGEQIKWAAVANQYFTTQAVILADAGATEETLRKTLGEVVWAKRTEISADTWRAANHSLTGNHRMYRVDGAIAMPSIALLAKGDPQATATRHIQLYAGPRELRRLRLLDNHESDVLDYGSFLGIVPTGPFSKFLLNSMNWLYDKVGSYALAIILLTLGVKAILWPLQSKANKNMKKMAELNPEIKRIQDKYKDDPVKFQQEMGKVWKKAGVNPLSGCWPIFIQIPIFMGFYNMLGKAVELRHHGFMWVKDLSAPDTVAHLFGLPINPLPLCMAATMFLSMKLTPSTGDPAQRRMFMLMPLMFVFMCYNFASALALYWTVQNIISIVQILINKANTPSAGSVELIPAK